ncbi:hypothetical protein BS78_04G201400 [Paspalum vaginatum]|nr:hypothetical protein BS78_04G201400 [Paspalum vaginatum]
MAARIFALLALLALSVSAASAVLIPQYSLVVPSYLQPWTAATFEHPIVQSYRAQQALAASLFPSVSTIFQQPWALQQQSSAHLAIQSVMALQHQQQQFLPSFNRFALANPAAYLQQQQLLRFNQLAVVNPTSYFLQQQLLPFNQLAVASPTSYFLQQQLLPFNQLAVANSAAYFQQQQFNTLAVSNAANALYQQQQQFAFNPLAATYPSTIYQQPIIGGAYF